MRPVRIIQLAALAGLLALSGSACSTKKVMQPNIAPQTHLFVQYDANDGGPHTVFHVARLYWYGSDPDGFVQGYDIRFIWPAGDQNPPWTRTANTDSLFVIPDTTGISNPTFQVRAVDNDGLADPQPPQQTFSFSNQAPVVTLVDPPGLNEVTFASQTIDWVGVDPDGDAGLLTFRVWLEGNQANPHILTGNELTLPTSDFLTGGQLRAGLDTATVFVQAIDPGGRVSNIASATWRVRPPVPNPAQRARLLLIDDISTADDASGNYDRFYNTAVANSGLPVGSWSVLQLESGRTFRSSKDLEQSLGLFDAVVWYRGSARYSSTRDTMLARHSDGLGAYLNAGGKFYLESLDMISSGPTSGLLPESFMQDFMGSDSLFKHKPFGSNDRIPNFSISRESYVDSINGVEVHHLALLHSTLFADSLESRINTGGLRAFGVRDTADVVLWARDSTLKELQPFDAPIAVKSQTTSGGKLVATSVQILGLGGFTAPTARFISKIFVYLGIAP